ncbi:MAG TPA: GlsB/YeaQ/YmgE family stress response membrane protein [Burkholderiales bacterium]|nr:GlsB/YeaQ/YmgE family stress response membrane protein [Burkholderiales bacterium]
MSALTGLSDKENMNIAMWLFAGALLGWIGYAVVKANRAQGMLVSIFIGAVGGFFGGNVLAPMLGAVAGTPNVLNLFSLVVASATAAACLAIGSLLSDRYGV